VSKNVFSKVLRNLDYCVARCTAFFLLYYLRPRVGLPFITKDVIDACRQLAAQAGDLGRFNFTKC